VQIAPNFLPSVLKRENGVATFAHRNSKTHHPARSMIRCRGGIAPPGIGVIVGSPDTPTGPNLVFEV
jgi:hypothetical protein